MHVLLTNDDGVDAPGLAALERAVQAFATTTIVAPHQGYSGCGHRVTNHEPIRVDRLDSNRFKVFGTPADCTRLGLRQFAPQADLVLAGVNDGANLGVDVYMSGTVAAVREAVWLGTPGIAFSQYVHQNRPRQWDRCESMVSIVWERLKEDLAGQPTPQLWNVNFPDVDRPVPELAILQAQLDPSHLHVDFAAVSDDAFAYRGDYRNRPHVTGSDVDVCFGGDISVSRLVARP